MSSENSLTLLKHPSLHGFQFGMLRDFESCIQELKSASIINAPNSPFPKVIAKRLQTTSRYKHLLNILPKLKNPIQADEVWSIQMGPEGYPLWHYKSWGGQVGRAVVYLFDTLRNQFRTTQAMLKATKWDDLITSFPMAVPLLEEATGRQWRAVPQAIDPKRFHPLEISVEPVIAFSSYGRKLPKVHDAIQRYCTKQGLHYDFSVSDGLNKSVTSIENYQLYAWHLRQSWFNICWSVETTNPERAADFSPLTCRWFEAAASGSVVIGDAPRDPVMNDCFGKEFVELIDPNRPVSDIESQLDDLWSRRYKLRTSRRELLQSHLQHWTWASRVRDIENGYCWYRKGGRPRHG